MILITLIGILFVFFIPGFLLTLIFFEKIELLEKIILSVALSISFFVILGTILGFNELMKNLTGGLSILNVWIYTLAFNIILAIIYFIKKQKTPKKHQKHLKE